MLAIFKMRSLVLVLIVLLVSIILISQVSSVYSANTEKPEDINGCKTKDDCAEGWGIILRLYIYRTRLKKI